MRRRQLGWAATWLAVAILVRAPLAAQVSGWPLPGPHPLLSTFDFDKTPFTTFHRGVDILALGCDPDPPQALVAVAGRLWPDTTVLDLTPADCPFGGLGVQIQDDSGTTYQYVHLACDWTDAFIAFGTAGVIPAGTEIAHIQCYDGLDKAGLDHLHYGVSRPLSVERSDIRVEVAPASTFAPFPDHDPPRVADVKLAADDAPATDTNHLDPWSELSRSAADTCSVAWGDVDVVANVADWFRNGEPPRLGDALAPRVVRVGVCAESDPACARWWPAMDMALLPSELTSGFNSAVWAWYSQRCEWCSCSFVSPNDGCYRKGDSTLTQKCSGDDTFWVVPTNVVHDDTYGLFPSRDGKWATNNPMCYPDGHYTVTVEAEDYAGNKHSRSTPVCVHNNPMNDCPAKLAVRDCDGFDATDDGAEPPSCTTWQSPDILVNPGAGAQTALVVGHDNTIRVCIRNVGCGDVDLGKKIVVEGWTYPNSAAIPNQGDPGTTAIPSVSYPDQQAALTYRDTNDPVTAAWKPGEERCLDLHWTPPPTLDPASVGGIAVVAYASDWDPKYDGVPVTLDNNRAARGVAWESESPGAVEPPGDVGDVGRTDLSEIKTLLDRHVKLEAFACAAQTVGPRAQVLLGPGSVARQVVGGVLVGYVSASEHASWDGSRPIESCSANPSGYMPCAQATAPQGARTWQVYSVDPAATEFDLFGLEIQGVAPAEVHRFGLPEPGGRPCPEPIWREFARRVTNGPEIEIGSRVLRRPIPVPARSGKRGELSRE